jgi:hypothetical protein
MFCPFYDLTMNNLWTISATLDKDEGPDKMPLSFL